MYQHQLCLGFNPSRVVIGSAEALPLKTGLDTKLMANMLTPEEKQVESVREELVNTLRRCAGKCTKRAYPPFGPSTILLS